MKQIRPFSMLCLCAAAAMMLATAHAQQSPIATPVCLEINTTTLGGGGIDWPRLVPYGSLVLVNANDWVNGARLYRIDAAASSPTPVPITTFGTGWGMDASNGVVYFGARQGTLGEELFRTDGTAPGTVFIKDIQTSKKSIYGSRPNTFRPLTSTKTIFIANTSTYTLQSAAPGTSTIEMPTLCITDGTAAGTFGLGTGKGWGSSEPTVVNGIAYCFMRDIGGKSTGGSAPPSKYGLELWKSDGTVAGTVMVKDINPGTADSDPRGTQHYPITGGLKRDYNRIVPFQNKVYFLATDGTTGFELWESDGTAAGTKLAADLYPGAPSGHPSWIVPMGDYLYFAGRNGNDGDKLMRYDPLGNPKVQVVADINTGTEPSDSSWVRWLTPVGNKLFFSAYHPSTGHEVYVSDGIPGGSTHVVADINPTGSCHPNQFLHETPWLVPTEGSSMLGCEFTQHNGWVYFAANDGTHGVELWRSNGSTTQLLTDINTDNTLRAGSSDIWNMTVAGGKLFFIGYCAATAEEVYMIDLASIPKSGSRAPVSPLALSLDPNYPNPFNPTTNITFTVPEAGPVSVRVYDALGREVGVLAEGVLDAGVYQRTFDAHVLPSGAYVCRLDYGEQALTRIMHLVK